MRNVIITRDYLTKMLVKRKKGNLFSAGRNQIELWDKEAAGFFVLIGKMRTSYMVQLSVPVVGSQQKFKTMKKKIGQFPLKTPDEMRKEAVRKIAEMRELKLDYSKPVPTFRTLFDSYLLNKTTKNRKTTLSKGTKDGYNSQIRKNFADILDIPLIEAVLKLTPQDMIDRHQDIRDNSGHGAALNTFSRFRAIMNFGKRLYPTIITSNPTQALTDAGVWTKTEPRKTMLLSSVAFAVFYKAVSSLSEIHRGCYLFAIYHGMRPSEAASIRWVDIDFKFKVVDLSWMSTETKHRRAQPLSRQSERILSERLQKKGPNDVYVFPSDHHATKSGHITLRADTLRSITGLDLTPHSLRRTFIMVADHLAVRREDTDRLTNHSDGTVTNVHYLVDLSLKKARKPLQLICDKIEAILLGTDSAEELFYEDLSDDTPELT
ncbi:MAG: tyrosine-type recombinase/integrase [Geobacteraceae bacterium]|nr:tyrosine-type recombinase/integrase [Geobacteraceae bacterium]NTW79211.1 tyrosine-type recombinase/integrase [Geobacteraceae bacterium]